MFEEKNKDVYEENENTNDSSKDLQEQSEHSEVNIICPKCGIENNKENTYCSACGASLSGNIVAKTNDEEPVRCPNCGSTQIDFVTYQENQNYDSSAGCCGFLLFGPIGLLCGTGVSNPAKTVRKCKKCGHEF